MKTQSNSIAAGSLDTIDIAGTRVRFNSIDAPESAQLCRNSKGKN